MKKLILSLFIVIAPLSSFAQNLTENLFTDLDKKINPAVVSISIGMNFRSQYPGGFMRDPLFDLFEPFMPYQMPPPQRQAPPQEEPAPQAIGTGFIIDASGLVITNYHVIEQADTVSVHLYSEKAKDTEKYDATVVGGDKRTDIALLQIKGTRKTFPVAPLGDSKLVQRGQWVAAFGNPYGHEFTITKGIISAIGRRIRDLNAVPFLQTDAAINPGNSGGPLVNTKGEVIGVNAAIDARAQGIGFAIPIDHVKSILPDLKRHGKVIRGYIGVQIGALNPRAQQALKLTSNKGALIVGVEARSPADKGGLKPYDVITKFGNVEVQSPDDLVDAVKDFPVNQTANVDIIREGKKKSVTIKVEEGPGEKPRLAGKRDLKKYRDEALPAPSKLGFKISNYSADLAKEMKLPPKTPPGPVVVEVEPQSPAAQNGLKVGDVILEVNKEPVKNQKQVMDELVKGQNILRVQHGEQINLVFLDI